MSFIESYGHVKWKHGICKKFAMSRTHVRERACEICGWTQTRLMLDHCHRHAWIRGWLCGKCNQEIRSFENGGTGTGPTWRRMLKWNANLRVEDFITHVDKCPECIWKPGDYCKTRCTLGLFGWFPACQHQPFNLLEFEHIGSPRNSKGYNYAFKSAQKYGTVCSEI